MTANPIPAARPAAPAAALPRRLRILLLVTAEDAVSRRVLVALREAGHHVVVATDAAAGRHRTDLILCASPEVEAPDGERCLVVCAEPGGVSVRDPRAGEVWATRRFRPREASRSSLERHEVRRAAAEAVMEAVAGIADGQRRGEAAPAPPALREAEARLDWSADRTATVVRRIHAGVLDTVAGTEFHLFGAHEEPALRGEPGEIVAQRHGAICRATTDGAVWISALARPGHFKLPATCALALAGHELTAPDATGWQELTYAERDGVGYLHFDFHDGAISTARCHRLLHAYRLARERDTRVIVLMGGADWFCSGMHLHLIEAAGDPAAASWRNLIALNELVREIIETDSHLVVAALAGDAAAGGVPLALAADVVAASEDVVLHPYFGHMGGFHGSGYWTYLLPRRVGQALAARLTAPPFEPVGAHGAVKMGLIDAAVGRSADHFRAHVRLLAEGLARDPETRARLADKQRARLRDERHRPLDFYRAHELKRSHGAFFGADRAYHEARRRFVRGA